MGEGGGDENDDGSRVEVAVVMVMVLVIIEIMKYNYIPGRGHSVPMCTKSRNSLLSPKSSVGRDVAGKKDR